MNRDNIKNSKLSALILTFANNLFQQVNFGRMSIQSCIILISLSPVNFTVCPLSLNVCCTSAAQTAEGMHIKSRAPAV